MMRPELSSVRGRKTFAPKGQALTEAAKRRHPSGVFFVALQPNWRVITL